jgi:hypothetical protein
VVTIQEDLLQKNFYLSIISAKRLLKVDTWKQKIWNWKAQLKVKLFVWLALEGKILTWDTLQKRGWTGPGHCPLCKSDLESVSHLFIYCPFAISVWNLVYKELNLNRSWTGNTLSDCLKSWYLDKSVPSHIAAYIIWYIWQERNKALFEDSSPSSQAVIYKILALSPCSISPKDKPPKDILISYRKDSTLAWFDGAAKSDGSICGAGGIIKVQEATVYRWTLNCGKGTNTKAELLGAWASLWLVDYLSLPDLHLLGDSKVVIDWLTKRAVYR